MTSTNKRLSIFLCLSLLVLSSFACFNPIPQVKAETWTWKDEFTDQNARWKWGYNAGTGTKTLRIKDGYDVVELKITAESTSSVYSDDCLETTTAFTFGSNKLIVLEGRMQCSHTTESPFAGTFGFGFWDGVGNNVCWFLACSPESAAECRGFRAMVRHDGQLPLELNQPLTVDLTQWHTFRIEASASGVIFKIDGAVVASTPYVPTRSMSIVVWHDNQYVTSTGERGGYLALSVDEIAWIDYIALNDNAPAQNWSLAISAGTGGSVFPIGTITGASGSSTPSITASPDAGYTFAYWLYDDTQYTQNPVSFTINDVASHTLQAFFALLQPPTAIFTNGFEDDFTSWTGVTGSPVTTATYAHHGMKSCVVNKATTGPYKSLGASYVDCYARCYVYFTKLPWATAYKINIMSLRNNAGAMPATLSVISDGTSWHLHLRDAWGAKTSGPDAIVVNTWYCVELRRQVGVGDQMWLNGVLQGSVAGAWIGNTDRLDIGGSEVQLSSVGYVDDVVVRTAYVGPEPTEPQWVLNIIAGTGGAVSPSEQITGAQGASTPSILATPSTGYQLSYWLLDGAAQYTQNPLTLTIDDALTHTLEAVFVQAPSWSLTISAGAGGSVTPSSASGLPGTSVTVTATANSGYVFSHWLYDSVAQYTQNPLTLTIDDVSPHTLEAVFTATSALTVTSPNGGESWVRGTRHPITWTSTGSLGAYVKIELLKGGTVYRIIAYRTRNDGSYRWRISWYQPVGTDYQIRITSTSYPSVEDSSNSYFAITG